MLKAHIECMKEVQDLPRKITKEDRKIKFTVNFANLFKKNENYRAVFNYNIYLEQKLSKTASKQEKKKAQNSLWKKKTKKGRRISSCTLI